MAAIQFKNVYIENENLSICEDVSLKINKNEIVYLIGKTGIGKSSILKTLYGAQKIKKGTLNVLDFDMNKINKKEMPFLRKKMGIVFQDFQLLYDRNVYKNLSFVLQATGWEDKTKIKNRCEYILETIGLKEKINDMLHKLSSGQQQKLCIGRALLNHPELIIADEPTGNLDSETSLEIMNLISKIHKLGKTIIITTHDEKIINLFPAKILKLEDKKLTEI
tara:strand:+ start:330 stop:992 length:663 start_codon:yes stop_codon:yes gene_type:complete